MIHRPTNVKGIVRKGRFDDYIKDINDTMDELVGCPDSISLKVGHGQFLEIPQYKFEVDKNLPFFKFAQCVISDSYKFDLSASRD